MLRVTSATCTHARTQTRTRTHSSQELKEKFSQYGAVKLVTLQGERGFAFVEFEKADAVAKCMANPLEELAGQPLKVEPRQSQVSE